MSAGPEAARPRAVVVWSLAIGAVTLIVAGGVVGAPVLLEAERAAMQAEGPALQPVDAGVPVKGNKPPEAFGFQAYPGSFGYFSMEIGPGHATSAFSVKSGTAADVLRFYRQSLEPQGWTFLKQGKLVQPLGEGPNAPPPAPGLSARWQREDDGRRFELKVFDLKQKGSTAQVLLGWAPRADASVLAE
ncbi:MAG: hypothetical protein ACK47B_01870 [Armatimonadota bacterium]